MAVFVVLALIAPGAVLRPGLDDEVVGLVETLAVVGRVDVVGDLLATRAPHPAGDETAARDHVDGGELLGQAQRIGHRQRIAHQRDFHPLGDAGQNGRLDIHHRAHGEGVGVVFVEHDAVETELLGIELFVQVAIEQGTAPDRVEKLVGNPEKARVLDHLVFRNIGVGAFGEGRDVHGESSGIWARRIAAGARQDKWAFSFFTNLSVCSISGR